MTAVTVVDEHTGGSWLDSGITLVVAVVAAAASAGHMIEVAQHAGEPLWLARAFPVTVDGLVLAALRRGPAGRRWLMLGIVVSIAANVLARFPEWAETAGPIVSAWPPLALYGTHRLLHGRGAERLATEVGETAGAVVVGWSDDAASSLPRGAGAPGDASPPVRRRGPAPSRARARASSSRTGRPRVPAADVAELLPVARQVAATLAAAGGTLTRDALVAGLRAEGYSVANARAGELLAILRRPGGGEGGNPPRLRPAGALALPVAGDRSATTIEVTG